MNAQTLVFFKLLGMFLPAHASFLWNQYCEIEFLLKPGKYGPQELLITWFNLINRLISFIYKNKFSGAMTNITVLLKNTAKGGIFVFFSF